MFKVLQKLMFASKQNSDRKLEMLNIFVFSGTLLHCFSKWKDHNLKKSQLNLIIVMQAMRGGGLLLSTTC